MGPWACRKGRGFVLSVTFQELTPHSPHFPKPLGMQRAEASSAPSPGFMHSDGACEKEGLHGFSPTLGACTSGKAESFHRTES